MALADDTPDAPHVDSGRRKILTAALYALPAAWVAGSLFGPPGLARAAPAASAAPPAFAAVSATLTGVAVNDDAAAQRAWAGLVLKVADFPATFERLAAALAAHGITRMQQLPAPAISNDPALKATAMAIIGAWYLGRVGDVVPREDMGPPFVTYTGALMWRPTLDVTVLPTYATGKPGHWSSKPASLATD